MKEIEFLDLFCEFLQQNGYKFKREVRKGSYHNEGYIDVVVKNGAYFAAIEAKMSGLGEVLSQARGNCILCRYSYVLYPRKPHTQKHFNQFTYAGLGLIIPIDGTHFEKFKVYIKPKHEFKGRYRYWKSIIRRNWYQNRVGRLLNPAEIPDGYDFKKLAPTYEWVTNKTDLSDIKARLSEMELARARILECTTPEQTKTFNTILKNEEDLIKHQAKEFESIVIQLKAQLAKHEANLTPEQFKQLEEME